MFVRVFAIGMLAMLLVGGCAAQHTAAPEPQLSASDIQRVVDAANRAEDAAKRAEVAAEKAEVIFHKSLHK